MIFEQESLGCSLDLVQILSIVSDFISIEFLKISTLKKKPKIDNKLNIISTVFRLSIEYKANIETNKRIIFL